MAADDQAVVIICKINNKETLTKDEWKQLLKHFQKTNRYMTLRLLKSYMREEGIIK